MRTTARFVFTSFLVASVGCEYGPEHIPSFRAARDAHVRQAEFFQGLMDSIAQKHGLPLEPALPTKSGTDSERQSLVAQLQGCAEENSQLATQVRDLQDEWFATMSKEQQIQWLIHKDKLAAEHDRLVSERESTNASRQLQLRMHQDQIREAEKERWRKAWTGDRQNVNIQQDVTVRRVPY